MVADEPKPRMCVMVDAANANHRPRKVVAVGLQLKNKKQVAITQPGSDKGLPCVLHETERVHYWASASEIGRELIRAGLTEKQQVRGFVRDSYGETHYSDWTEFDPSYWAAQGHQPKFRCG